VIGGRRRLTTEAAVIEFMAAKTASARGTPVSLVRQELLRELET
jgi:hypothetical protein